MSRRAKGLQLADTAFLGRAAGGGFNPATLLGGISWWKADSYSLADNTTIGGAGLEWIDQIGSNDMTSSGLGDTKYRTLGIGGAHPSIENTGAGLIIPAITLPGDFTLIIVAETLGDTSWLGNNAANVQVRRRRSGVNNMSFLPGSGSEAISNNFSSADADVVMLTYRRSGISGSLWENKTDRTTPNSVGGSFTINRMGFSQFVGGIGDVGEIVIYSVSQSDGDIMALYDAYFKPRWGLP